MLLLKQHSQILKKDLDSNLYVLNDYLRELQEIKDISCYEKKESFVNLPFAEFTLKNCFDLKRIMVSKKLKYLVVVGIGGSDLGTKAIYNALHGFYDELEPNRFPKIIFLETTNSRQIDKITKLLKDIEDPQEVLINVVSKSGKTLETISNMEVLLQEISYTKDRLVITTTEESELFAKATEMKIPTLIMPKVISGRFSVFSAVGIFPLLVMGIDVVSLMEGAMEATKDCLTISIKNPALQSATFLKKAYHDKMEIHNLFVFEPELESVGGWYEQLISESLGKDHKGITPLTSVGSRDLHSEMQLDLAGPRDKIFTFVWTDENYSGIKLNRKLKVGVREEIEGKDIGHIESVILQAAKHSYENNGIRTLSIKLGAVSEKELGYFLQYKMIEVALLGKLMKVDAFEQPAVEEYKKEARRILKSEE
ncbi:hypothetical protein HYV31_03020 [candidate division WWE3 bacterium]|nr:hypothetical protein [candidate division WWE3 bacterium]